MDGFADRRSMPLMWSVIGVLGLGVVLAYSLPALNEPGDYYDAPSKVSLMQVNYALNLSGSGWFLDFLKAGILVAIVAAIAFPKRDRVLQGVTITTGSLFGLCLPYWVHGKLGGGESLGVGLWLLGIACLIAAILPWAAPSWEASQAEGRASTSASAPAYVAPPAASARPRTLTARPSAGEPGASLRVQGSGFPAGQRTTVEWVGMHGTRPLGEPVATTTGEIDLVATAPLDQPPGEYTIRAMTPNGLRATASFTLLPAPVSEATPAFGS